MATTPLAYHGVTPSDHCGTPPNLLSCASGPCLALIHSASQPAPEPTGHRILAWTPLVPETLSLSPEPPPPEA